MILFTDSKENVEYAIIVDMSVNANDKIFADVQALYDAIVADANYVTYDLTVENLVANTEYTLVDATGKILSATGDVYTVENGTYTLTLTAKPGYDLSKDVYVTENNKAVADNGGHTYTITVNGMDVVVEINSEATVETYTITYDLKGGTEPTPANPTSYTVTTKDAVLASIKEPTKVGYLFDGWTVTGAGADGLGNLTYTANWKDDMVTLTVEFYNQKGQLINSWNNEQRNGETVTVALDKLAAYTVNGGDEVYGNKTNGAEVTVDGDTLVKVNYIDTVTVNVVNEFMTNSWSVTTGAELTLPSGATSVEFELGAPGLNNAREVTYEINGETFTVDATNADVDADMDVSIPVEFLSEELTITITNIGSEGV